MNVPRLVTDVGLPPTPPSAPPPLSDDALLTIFRLRQTMNALGELAAEMLETIGAMRAEVARLEGRGAPVPTDSDTE